MRLLRKILKNLIWALFCGILFMWGTFWYISGSPSGILRFFFVYYTTQEFFYQPVNKEKIFEGMLKGMVNSLNERHSMYLNPEEFKKLQEISHSSYVGIGIYLGSKDNIPMVISPIEDSPAEKAGLKAGDLIKKVDGKDTANMSLDEVSSMIRGKAGTSVTLEIDRSGEIKTFTVERAEVVLATIKSKMLNDQIAYIRITNFAEATGSDFGKAYEDLKSKGMKKLVVDLRGNPGGLVTAAAEVSDYLLPKGPIVSIKTRRGQEEVYSSKGKVDLIPLVVLVDKGSASASELLSAAIQDKEVGTILGTTTYGKGTVQSVLPGPGNDAVKLTIAKYHTPKDRVIDGTGVKPDIEVASPAEGVVRSEDSQLNKAIEVLKGQNKVGQVKQ